MTQLKIAKDLTLPLDVVTESLGILAVKRAGKSHTAKKLVEQLHRAGQQIVVVDPKGDWWGLRSSADGKAPGVPIVILGGEHGDVPLEVGSGELVARMAVQERVSVLIDLSIFRKHEVATFMTAFLETLYRLKAKEEYRTPMMLVIDEADAIAPQRPMKGEERMLGAAEDIVRRGGQRGIGIVMVSQRAAVLNKNVLTQVGILVLLRTTGSQDIDAVDAWIVKHGQPDERAQVMATIASQPRGTAWIWAPGWPDEKGIFRQVVILPLDTFDSGATPKAGQRRVMPKTLADVDMGAFRREMAATIEKAKAEDPKELRRRLAEREKQIKELQRVNEKHAALGPRSVEAKSIEVPALKDGQIERFAKAVERLATMGETLIQVGNTVLSSGRELAVAIKSVNGNGNNPGNKYSQNIPAARPTAALIKALPSVTKRNIPPTEGITETQQRILDTVAMLYGRGLTPNRESVARWMAIHPNGGRYGTDLGQLRANGYLDGFRLTEAGEAAARPGPTDFSAALAALPDDTKRKILTTIADVGSAFTRDTLADALGIHPNGGRYGTDLGWLRTMGLLPARGAIHLTDAANR